MADEATPRPWHTDPDEYGCRSIVAGENDADGIFTASLDIGFTHGLDKESQDAANAALIVRAVNAHDALVELLECIEDHDVRSLSCDRDGQQYCQCVAEHVRRARTALDAATEGGA